MKNKGLRGKLILISLLIILLVSLSIYNKNTNHKVITNNIKQPEVKEVVKQEYISKIRDYQKEYNNEDIIAELVIEDLDIKTLITKTTNNEFYLNHNIEKQESNLGNPYIDYRNTSILDEERQINIYSHNSDYYYYQEKLPFNKLEKLLDKETFDKTNNIYLLTETKKIKYEIVSVKIITDSNEHMVLDSKSKERWQEHLNDLLSDTTYCKKDCTLNQNDQLLILQTCNYKPRGSYILVISKKIKGEE